MSNLESQMQDQDIAVGDDDHDIAVGDDDDHDIAVGDDDDYEVDDDYEAELPLYVYYEKPKKQSYYVAIGMARMIRTHQDAMMVMDFLKECVGGSIEDLEDLASEDRTGMLRTEVSMYRAETWYKWR